jgi:hypothetical protein
MSRKQAICYLVILCVLVMALLVLLAIYNIGLMLLAVLLLVIGMGILKKTCPQLFAIFQKPDKKSAIDHFVQNSSVHRRQYVPNLILVANNLTSVGQVVVDKPVFTIGRDGGCDFSLAGAPDISRVHATIRYDEKTAASYIVDNNSHNGTFVNGVKLPPGKQKRINNGDLLQLGTIRFTAQVAHY